MGPARCWDRSRDLNTHARRSNAIRGTDVPAAGDRHAHVGAALSFLSDFAGDVCVHRSSMQYLRRLLASSPVHVDAFESMNGMEVVGASMSRFCDRVGLVTPGCAVLVGLLSRLRARHGRIDADHAGVSRELLDGALRSFPSDAVIPGIVALGVSLIET